MAGMVEKKLQELGVVVPEPTTPSANYVPFVRTGNLLTVSGQAANSSPPANSVPAYRSSDNPASRQCGLLAL